ncbi:DsbA family protein [Cellulomonas sp. P24]|uniref:DsbA family protein n=1 Tax=Cellulomonas sp. P24 TaxID=2885206 RepID=UPI00216AD471|nr:DsbA family protein [Cellulomonas sp. P24]MCR6491479.1 DsbA family protein [Cellulomonas sp. P24]
MTATDQPIGPVGRGRHVYGPPDAPVTVVEFGDLECPYCRAAAPVLRELVDTAAGTVRLVFRHFPLFEVHPHALTAALAVEAAASQGAFWPMFDRLVSGPVDLGDAALRAAADELGLDGSLVVGEAAQRHGDWVEEDYADGRALDVRGTPTLFVNDERFSGQVTLTALRACVAQALGAGRGVPTVGAQRGSPPT